MSLTPEELAAKEKQEKADALKEIQNRLLSMETELKKVKGADAENIRAIAKTEMAALETEIANLKMAITLPSKKEEKEEKSWLAEFWPF